MPLVGGHSGTNISTGDEVAIKLESVRSKHPQLMYESKLYKILLGGIGIPTLYWYGIEGDYNVMIIELLGPSLEDLFSICNRKLSLKTVLMLADQMVRGVQLMGTSHRETGMVFVDFYRFISLSTLPCFDACVSAAESY